MFENPEHVFGGTSELLSLIEMIYAAIEEPELWPVFLDRVADVVEGKQTFMFTDLPDPAIPKAMIGARTDPEALHLLLAHYASINIFAEPADAVFQDGDIRYSHWVVPDDVLERSEFYNDFFKPFDMHYSYGINVPLAGMAPVYLSSQRPKDAPAFGEREGMVLKVLMPHVQRAFGLHARLARAGGRASGMEAALDAFEHAVFGLNREGRVVFSSRRADAMLRDGDGLMLSQGRLSAVFPEQNRGLQGMLAKAVDGGETGMAAGGSMLVDRVSLQHALRVTVSPLPARTAEGASPMAALVFVSDPAKRLQPRGELLRAMYGLTPSEARVADMLMQGLEVREAGTRLGMTLETTRFHTKRVLSKTGMRRQAELMKLMLSLPGA